MKNNRHIKPNGCNIYLQKVIVNRYNFFFRLVEPALGSLLFHEGIPTNRSQ